MPAAGNQSSRSGVSLCHAGLHNRSRNRARNWVHSRIWRPRDYFLSTPPTRKTAIVPFLRLSLPDCTSYGSMRWRAPLAAGTRGGNALHCRLSDWIVRAGRPAFLFYLLKRIALSADAAGWTHIKAILASRKTASIASGTVPPRSQ